MTVDISFPNILLYLLVWARLAGMILFNPLLSRQNVPAMARMGLIFFLTFLVAPLQPPEALQAVYQMNTVGFILTLMWETGIGLVFGYIFQVFYYLLFFVGDLIDTDIGFSMAKTFDPNTNIQMAFSSSIITILFSLYIFVTNSHLALIRVFTDSFAAIPVGSFSMNVGIITFALRLFSEVFMLALRLYAPFMVAEVVLQAAMGILMKFVPQVTIFSVNFQLRIGIGVIMLYSFAPYIGQFIDTYIDAMFDSLIRAAELMMQGGALLAVP